MQNFFLLPPCLVGRYEATYGKSWASESYRKVKTESGVAVYFLSFRKV